MVCFVKGRTYIRPVVASGDNAFQGSCGRVFAIATKRTSMQSALLPSKRARCSMPSAFASSYHAHSNMYDCVCPNALVSYNANPQQLEPRASHPTIPLYPHVRVESFEDTRSGLRQHVGEFACLPGCGLCDGLVVIVFGTVQYKLW